MAFTIIDIAPNPIKANGIYTVEDCKIRMESEVVEVELFREKSIVNCTFKMVNYGEAKSLEVGFPVMDFHYWDLCGYSEIDKSNFTIKIDSNFLSKNDIKVPKELDSVYNEFMTRSRLNKENEMKIDSIYKSHNVKRRKDGSLVFPKGLNHQEIQEKIDSINRFYWDRTGLSGDLIAKFHELTENGKFPWYIWDVKFKENETKIIKVSYELPSGIAYATKFRYFKYILNTGAGWYKDIGKADIIINLHGIDFNEIEDIKPNNYQLDKINNRILFSFENIEPTEQDNIYLQYSIPSEKRQYNKYKRKLNGKYKNQ